MSPPSALAAAHLRAHARSPQRSLWVLDRWLGRLLVRLLVRLGCVCVVCCLGVLGGEGWVALGQDADPIATLDPVAVSGATPQQPPLGARDAQWVKRLDLSALAAAGEGLVEGLARTPGLSVRALGGGLQPREVMIRGASGRQTLILFEGVRLNSVSGGAFDLSLLPEGLPGGVEVVRGGGEVMWGSGAQGGVVSLRVLEGVARGGPQGAAHGGGGGGLKEGSGWGWLAAAPADGVRVGAGVGFRQVWGGFDFVDGQGTARRRENVDGRQGSAWAVIEGAWGALKVRLVSLGGSTVRGFGGPAEFPKQFREAELEEGMSVTAARADWVAARGAWGLVEVAAQTSWRSASQYYVNPTALLGGHAFGSRYEEGTWAAELSAALIFESLEVRVGATTRVETLTRAVGGAPADFSRAVGAGFLWAQGWLWGDRVEVGGGVRVEGAEGIDAVWVPRFSLGVRPWASLLLQSSAGGKLRLPAFDELYMRTEFVHGSPDLRPERGWHIDAGAQATPWDGLRLEASVFYMQHDDLILFIPTSALAYEARNLMGARTRGVELEALWSPTPPLTLGSAYTWMEATLASDPQPPLPGRPVHQWDAYATWEVTSGLKVTSGLRYTGERFLDALGKRPQPGWWALSASVTWQATPSWGLGARGANLLDIQDAVDALQQPLPGMTWQLWAQWAPFADSTTTP
jgi:vitamin B12 transporter